MYTVYTETSMVSTQTALLGIHFLKGLFTFQKDTVLTEGKRRGKKPSNQQDSNPRSRNHIVFNSFLNYLIARLRNSTPNEIKTEINLIWFQMLYPKGKLSMALFDRKGSSSTTVIFCLFRFFHHLFWNFVSRVYHLKKQDW